MFSEQPNPKAALHLRALRLQPDPADMLHTLSDILIDRPQSRWDVINLQYVEKILNLLHVNLLMMNPSNPTSVSLRYDTIIFEHLSLHRFITMRTIRSILARTQKTHPIDEKPYLQKLLQTFNEMEDHNYIRRVFLNPLPDPNTASGIRQLFAGTSPK